MAKAKNSIAQDTTPDFLCKEKNQFEKELQERIEKGLALKSLPVHSHDDLLKMQEEFSYWHDYNKELLRRAFNKVNNRYYEDYTQTSSGGMFITSIYDRPKKPSLGEQVSSQQEHIEKYITRLKKIQQKLPLIEELPGLNTPRLEIDERKKVLGELERMLARFHKSAQSLRNRRLGRSPVLIADEYDVQYLLRAFLKLHFDDIREEDYVPSYAGGNSRVDFVLRREKLVIGWFGSSATMPTNSPDDRVAIFETGTA